MKKILGIPMALFVVGLFVIGGATAALLAYYGTITANVNVQQSILLDGLAWPESQVTDAIPEAAPGGQMFCFDHSLTNQMSETGQVNLATVYSPDGVGITTTFLGDLPYSFTYDVGGVNVVVEDTGDSIKWTYTGGTQMSVAINFPAGFAIHTSDGHCAAPGWYYSIDGGASCQALPAWATTTGSEGDGVKTVSIKKSALGSTFKWHGYSVVTGTGVWIGIGPDNGGVWEPKFSATIKGPLTLPVTLASKETKDFSVCYAFAQNIYPGTYIITTNAVPVLP